MSTDTDRYTTLLTRGPDRPKGMRPEAWERIRLHFEEGKRTLGEFKVALKADVRAGDLLGDDLPKGEGEDENRTYYRWLERLNKFYQSEPATLGDIPPEHSAYVFEVLAAVIAETRGAVHHLVRAEVDWIIRVHAATAGDNPRPTPWQVYQFARAYWTAQTSGESTIGIDLTLAYFKPWVNSWDKLIEAALAGWVPREVKYPGPYSGRAYTGKEKAQ